MNKKILIAFGICITIILTLSLVIIFRKPTIIVEPEDNKRAYEDSIKILMQKVSDRDLSLLKSEKIIDSINSLKTNNNIRYVQDVKFINFPTTKSSSLDSIVRKISGLPQR